VAYNRSELVREALDALAAQTRPVDRLIVVDNASDDGTRAVVQGALADWAGTAELICLDRNTGGAGGFAVGIAAAFVQGEASALSQVPTDWIWVMDDDTVPSPEALEGALAAHERYVNVTGRDALAIMGSRVVWTDGADHPMNTPKPKIGASRVERERAETAGVMPIRSISFVSAFLRASRVAEVGLPVADYFLWNDDFEFSARMLRRARGIFVPGSVVTHKTKARGSSDQDPGERFFFEVRNKLWVFRGRRALKWWESVLYQGASARRWWRTYRGSCDRQVLRDCLHRGWNEGWRSRPRPNAVSLHGAGVPVAVLRKITHFDAIERANGRRG